MDWDSLLQPYRLGCPKDSFDGERGRSEFHRDFDRIIFSTHFRRLFGKTQVVPFPNSDLTHNRLTHSLETASVGRSLGNYLKEDVKSSLRDKPYDIGALVAAACLAHDIGNPPLGHSGESAIQKFFADNRDTYLKDLTADQQADFLNFDGNAMGFRMLTHSNIKKTSNPGGLGITLPTLSAFVKYPCASYEVKAQGGTVGEYKKGGLFSADVGTYSDIAFDLKIPRIDNHDCWQRHPLTYLVEAADDICNCIIDFEDGYKHQIIAYDDLYEKLKPIAEERCKNIDTNLQRIKSYTEKAGYLRAKAINSLVIQAGESFVEHMEEYRSSTIKVPLIKTVQSAETIEKIKEISKEKLYNQYDVLLKEIAGFKVLSGLLEIYLDATMNPECKRAEKIIRILPNDITKEFNEDPYLTLMDITAYVCGMTDKFAVDRYRMLTGIEIPDY